MRIGQLLGVIATIENMICQHFIFSQRAGFIGTDKSDRTQCFNGG